MATKMTTSADDLVWFSRYVLIRPTLSIVVYASTLNGIVLAAWIGGRALLTWISADQISTVSFTALLLFAVWTFVRDRAARGKPASTEEPLRHSREQVALRVGVVTALGSLDELVVFTALFAADVIPLQWALVGTTLAGFLVAAACLGLMRVKALVTAVERVPEWALIGLVGLLGLAATLGK